MDGKHEGMKWNKYRSWKDEIEEKNKWEQFEWKNYEMEIRMR